MVGYANPQARVASVSVCACRARSASVACQSGFEGPSFHCSTEALKSLTSPTHGLGLGFRKRLQVSRTVEDDTSLHLFCLEPQTNYQSHVLIHFQPSNSALAATQSDICFVSGPDQGMADKPSVRSTQALERTMGHESDTTNLICTTSRCNQHGQTEMVVNQAQRQELQQHQLVLPIKSSDCTVLQVCFHHVKHQIHQPLTSHLHVCSRSHVAHQKLVSPRPNPKPGDTQLVGLSPLPCPSPYRFT